MFELSVLVPARNEMFLQRTIEDVLENSDERTEIIVVLDGYWPDEGLPIHPRVTIIHHEVSIGQRAATNEAARVSRAPYIMKLDAHCAMGKGFDAKLIEAAVELGDDVTQVPLQRNLHIFDWKCDHCGKRTYQGPEPTECECGEKFFHRKMVWKPRRGTRTTFWIVDSDLKFQYGGKPKTDGDFEETMSLLGACWFLSRERFWNLDGLDEKHGSWGAMGCEVGLKSWLSGGRVVTNKRTFFSHLFRTQGQGFGFPYPISGRQVSRARKYSQSMWRKNAWPKQVRPLSWLLDYFWPVKGWTDAARAEIAAAGVSFTVPSRVTNLAIPMSVPPLVGKEVSFATVGLPGLPRSRTVATKDIDSGVDKLEMSGVAASRATTDVVDNQISALRTGCPGQTSNQPCVHDPVHTDLGARCGPTGETDASITEGVGIPGPVPAASAPVDNDLGKDSRQGLAVEVGNREKLGVSHPSIIHQPSKGIVYYSDCKAPAHILEAARNRLSKIAAERDMPIMAVTLSPVPFGTNVVIPLERGILTMFKQILVGLELIDADVVYFCEHDCLYNPSHFDFTPPSDQIVYYNTNVWKVNADTGDALYYITKQTSGLCAYRELLLEHYRKRVAMVEEHGFSRKMGFEPGSHGRAERVDDLKSEAWMSEFPNIDIRHGDNLTPSRWRQDQFRNQRSCRGWKEAGEVPGWGKTKGRFGAFLQGAR